MGKKKARKKKATVKRKTTAKKKTAAKRKKAPKRKARKKKPSKKKASKKKKARTKKRAATKKTTRKTAAKRKKPATKKNRAQRAAKKKKRRRRLKLPKSLGRPRLPGDAKLDLVFQKDYQAREIFAFLGVQTIRELEQFGPDEIVERLTNPVVQTVQRIRKALALNNRCLADDREFALSFQEQWRSGRR